MWEYEVTIKGENEKFFIFGYNFPDACRRAGLSPESLTCLLADYPEQDDYAPNW